MKAQHQLRRPRIVGQGWEIEDADLYKLEISLDSTPCCLSDVRLRKLLKNDLFLFQIGNR
jgi:hypothetical protein